MIHRPNSPSAPSSQPPALTVRHLIYLLTLGGIWGASYLCIKLLVDVASPSAMIAVRMALGAGVLGTVLLVRGGRLPPRSRLWGHLLTMAVFGNVVPFLLIAWSQKHATSAIAAVLNATIPFFTLIFAAVVFRIDRITPARLAGITLGFAGVAFLTGGSVLDVGSSGGLGELALLGSTFCYGFAFAYARRFIHGDPLANVTAQLLMGLVIMLPITARGGWVHLDQLGIVEAVSWVVLGAVGTGMAYIFYYSLIADIGAVRASLVTYLIPPVGIILGWLFLDESLGLTGLFGMLLIVLGIAVSYGWHRQLLRKRGVVG